MKTQDPIRLNAFRKSAGRRSTTAIDHQFRLSFGLAAILLAASLTVGLTTLSSAPSGVAPAAQASAEVGAARG
ncbi:MAG: hypothetical protein LCH47_13205 [Proteobacteria bacterium]|nr:hypothetical protein [Pseudomonadota bacterium]